MGQELIRLLSVKTSCLLEPPVATGRSELETGFTIFNCVEIYGWWTD